MHNPGQIQDYQDFKELQVCLSYNRKMGRQSLYRGQANKDWLLECSLQRLAKTFDRDELWKRFEDAFREFKAGCAASGYGKFRPETENEDFYYLSIARHLGLPCNLLDWTSSLDMAAVMACTGESDADGVIWIMYGALNLNDKPFKGSPLTLEKSVPACKDFDFIPDGVSFREAMPLAKRRRFCQNGFFSIIAKSDMGTNLRDLLLPVGIDIRPFIIPQEAKATLLKEIQSQCQYENRYVLDADSEKYPELALVNCLNEKYFGIKK